MTAPAANPGDLVLAGFLIMGLAAAVGVLAFAIWEHVRRFDK